MIYKQDGFQDAYQKLLEAAPDFNQRELQVALGVGLGPGIKKFSMNGNTITITGKPKETGAYSATIKIVGSKAKLSVDIGKMHDSLKQRIADAFDAQGIDIRK